MRLALVRHCILIARVGHPRRRRRRIQVAVIRACAQTRKQPFRGCPRAVKVREPADRGSRRRNHPWRAEGHPPTRAHRALTRVILARLRPAAHDAFTFASTKRITARFDRQLTDSRAALHAMRVRTKHGTQATLIVSLRVSQTVTGER